MVPNFQELDPKDVRVGRGKAYAAQVALYVDAIKDQHAGMIEPDENESTRFVRRILASAARQLGFKVRCSIDEEKRQVFWKRIGA